MAYEANEMLGSILSFLIKRLDILACNYSDSYKSIFIIKNPAGELTLLLQAWNILTSNPFISHWINWFYKSILIK